MFRQDVATAGARQQPQTPSLPDEAVAGFLTALLVPLKPRPEHGSVSRRSRSS